MAARAYQEAAQGGDGSAAAAACRLQASGTTTRAAAALAVDLLPALSADGRSDRGDDWPAALSLRLALLQDAAGDLQLKNGQPGWCRRRYMHSLHETCGCRPNMFMSWYRGSQQVERLPQCARHNNYHDCYLCPRYSLGLACHKD